MIVAMPSYVKSLDLEILEELMELKKNPRFKLLQEQVHGAREEYFASLARALWESKGPVNQREIDQKRGFWEGAIWALRDLPAMNEVQWKKFIEQDPEEAE